MNMLAGSICLKVVAPLTPGAPPHALLLTPHTFPAHAPVAVHASITAHVAAPAHTPAPSHSPLPAASAGWLVGWIHTIQHPQHPHAPTLLHLTPTPPPGPSHPTTPPPDSAPTTLPLIPLVLEREEQRLVVVLREGERVALYCPVVHVGQDGGAAGGWVRQGPQPLVAVQVAAAGSDGSCDSGGGAGVADMEVDTVAGAEADVGQAAPICSAHPPPPATLTTPTPPSCHPRISLLAPPSPQPPDAGVAGCGWARVLAGGVLWARVAGVVGCRRRAALKAYHLTLDLEMEVADGRNSRVRNDRGQGVVGGGRGGEGCEAVGAQQDGQQQQQSGGDPDAPTTTTTNTTTITTTTTTNTTATTTTNTTATITTNTIATTTTNTTATAAILRKRVVLELGEGSRVGAGDAGWGCLGQPNVGLGSL